MDLRHRSLAPDLARGCMLLFIALAHAPVFVSDWNLGPAVLDNVAAFLKSLVADNQARAMFVFLFGYGLGQLAHRTPDRVPLLRRRAFWLLVIGFLHTVVLVPIDIIAIYGAALLIFAPMVRARDSVLLWTAGLTLIPGTLVLAWQSVIARVLTGGRPVTVAEYMEPTFGSHLLANIPSWPIETLVGVAVVLPGMLLGVWAARRRILDSPEEHARLLLWVTVVGSSVALIGRLPAALVVVGAWSTSAYWPIAIAHDLTGYVGGIAMAAAVGLAALASRRGRLTMGIAALGQRSLTFYLFQSMVWLVVFYPFGLDLRDDMGYAAAFGLAITVWAVSIPLAGWMRRAGHRGPFELLLRRLSYGRHRTPSAARSGDSTAPSEGCQV